MRRSAAAVVRSVCGPASRTSPSSLKRPDAPAGLRAFLEDEDVVPGRRILVPEEGEGEARHPAAEDDDSPQRAPSGRSAFRLMSASASMKAGWSFSPSTAA